MYSRCGPIAACSVLHEEGRRPDRKRIFRLKNLREWFWIDSTSLFRAAVFEICIAMMIANLHMEEALKEDD